MLRHKLDLKQSYGVWKIMIFAQSEDKDKDMIIGLKLNIV